MPAAEVAESSGARETICTSLAVVVSTASLPVTAVLTQEEPTSPGVHQKAAHLRGMLTTLAPVISQILGTTNTPLGTATDTTIVSPGTVAAAPRTPTTPGRSPSTRASDRMIAGIMEQFMSTARRGIELICSDELSFGSVQPLLDDCVRHLKGFGGHTQAAACQAQIDKLEEYSVALQNLQSADVLATSQLELARLMAEHNRKLEEMERAIDDGSRTLNEMRTTYEAILASHQEAELGAQRAAEAVQTAQEAIAKAQARLQESLLALELRKGEVAQFSAESHRLYSEIQANASALETLRTDHARISSVSEQDLRSRAWEATEEVRQREMALLKRQIESLFQQL